MIRKNRLIVAMEDMLIIANFRMQEGKRSDDRSTFEPLSYWTSVSLESKPHIPFTIRLYNLTCERCCLIKEALVGTEIWQQSGGSRCDQTPPARESDLHNDLSFS